MGLSRSIPSINYQARGERCAGQEPLLSHNTVTGWATQQEVLGYDIDSEITTIALPTRKVDELHVRLAEWPAGRQTATARELLVFAIRPGRYFVRRLLQLSKLAS